MADITTFLGLEKPIAGEKYSRALINRNSDRIETFAEAENTSRTPPAWVDITSSLGGAWVAYSGGGNYYNGLRARKLPSIGSIQMQGMIKSGAAGSIIIAAMPFDFRNAYSFMNVVEISSGTQQLATIHFDSAADTMTYRIGANAPTYLNINVIYPAENP